MLRELFTALLCGFAVAGQICAQEVVVAREAKPNSSERVAPVSEETKSESETATVREKKSASITLTVEEMRMAGAIAAERQKNQGRVEQASTTSRPSLPTVKAGALAVEQKKETRAEQRNTSRASTSQTTKSEAVAPVRPTMIESGKQEPAASKPAEVRRVQTSAPQPQTLSGSLRKQPTTVSQRMNNATREPDAISAQSAHSELHLPSRDQETTKEKTAKRTRTVAHYSYKTQEGKKESASVITHYYPKQIVYPFAKIDRHIDGKLMQAATIAQERAHAHSRSMCWHYVKEALLASGVIDSRPKSELAKDAAQDLVSNYGFKKLSMSDPFAAPVGSVLVYGANRAAGHVEIRTRDGFVSDFYSKTPSPRPLLGVYAKL